MADRLTPLPPSSGWDVWPAGYEIPRLPYRVIRALGKGGMGIVYEVEDVRDGSRRAVKAILRHLTGDRDAIRRLRFEVQTARSLPPHPGLPAIGNLFKTPDGVVGFDMELLEGFSLRDTLRRGQQLPPVRAAELAIDVLSALEVVHCAGYVHRDVKPNNIFLATGGRVVLLDFGVAKALFDAPGRPSTAKGSLPGTPNYMAPEYLSESNAISAKFDIYAAGLVLWECITGRAAFAQKNVLQTTHAIVTAGVPSLVKMGFDWLPRDFLNILERATAKDPADRYETAGECARDLSAVLPLLLSFPPPTRASIPSVPPERTADLGPKAVLGLAPPASLEPQGVPAASEAAAPGEGDDPPSALSLGDDAADATEVRMPTLTVVLHVGQDGAQGSPPVLVRAQGNGAGHPAELVSPDDVTTAKRADLAAYLSTVDPHGGTDPDPLALDSHGEGGPAIDAGVARTLRSQDGSGEPGELAQGGQTTRDAPRGYPEGHGADSDDEWQRSSSPEGLSLPATAEQLVDTRPTADELGPPSGLTSRDEAGSPTPAAGAPLTPPNDVTESPKRGDRAAEPDEGEEEDEATLWGPTWPLYMAPPSHLFLPPRRRPWPSESTRAEEIVSTPPDSARPAPEGRNENDDNNSAVALPVDDGPPLPESHSEEERLRELLPDMETNLRNPLAVVAAGPEPEQVAEEVRPPGSTGRGAGATIVAMAKALAGMLRPLGLSLASRAVRLFALAAGRRTNRATAAALPAPTKPQPPAAAGETNPPTKERT